MLLTDLLHGNTQRLRDYALQHPECSAIMRIID
ncbi:antirestriction protein [Escherichia coli]|nr:antirestriction protein [Escherichia coli]